MSHKSKIISLEEVHTLIHSGDTIGVGGMTLYRRPVSLMREVMRSGQKDLQLVAITCGFESDLLVGQGQVSQVSTGYFGLEFLGLAPCFTRKAKEGVLKIREETEISMILGLKATTTGVSFMPSRFGQHLDLLKVREDVKKVACPYTGDLLIAWPSITLDLVFIHVNACDEVGNAYMSGQISIDALMCSASKKVILSTERIVPRSELIGKDCEIIGKTVDYVVVAPFGAHPTSLYPIYRVDVPYLVDYIKYCRERRFGEFVDKKVLIPEEEYLQHFIDKKILTF
jgi:glutaconate CoA-transferase subunit A